MPTSTVLIVERKQGDARVIFSLFILLHLVKSSEKCFRVTITFKYYEEESGHSLSSSSISGFQVESGRARLILGKNNLRGQENINCYGGNIGESIFLVSMERRMGANTPKKFLHYI